MSEKGFHDTPSPIMKKFWILSLLISTTSVAAELPLKTKQIIFDEIAMSIYFEDEGMIRGPSNLNDFSYIQTDESQILVSGDSYSQWDDKVIHYDCMVQVLTRGTIKSAKDIDVRCTLSGENWPND